MPLLRYFLFVGGCLLALLFVADASMPAPEVTAKAGPGIDRSIIRIASERKVAPAIVFDTTQPVIAALPVPTITPVAKAEPETVRQAYAQMQTDPTPMPKPVATRLRPKPKKARVARRQSVIAFRQDASRALFPAW